TCTNDCDVQKGELLTVRFNRSGTGSTFANRNIALTINGVGQINTSRRNAAILSSGSGFGNYSSPWVDTTNAARAERDTLVQHLAVQVPEPALAPFTVSVCRANAALPRTCVQTGLVCMVD